jgi:hypothetical protein
MTVVEEMTAYRNALLNESFSESLGGRDYIIRYEPDSERNPMYVKDSIGEDETPNKMLAYKFTKSDAIKIAHKLHEYDDIYNIKIIHTLDESWDEKMHTAEKDKGKFKGWTLSELKAELAKCKKNPNKTEALKKKEHQLSFAIRAKQKNKWGSIKESEEEDTTPDSNSLDKNEEPKKLTPGPFSKKGHKAIADTPAATAIPPAVAPPIAPTSSTTSGDNDEKDEQASDEKIRFQLL